ncbi:hypothetical protein ACOT81_28270 [Streptomyces sp. WI04-05B]|uniref:hypothetical protein n=1 Tax=Streptomyces TaxID=1883 RepID=UPI0029A6A9E8|nr:MULTISPECIES: hypothetical protein [unclassified Streptomyces]MDX2544427.1 hypothetical protein [Streptomyces sp. WI04-05B]MDX2588504.1 hypothetical protein [Streptomyces sp. WI04-05A]MDX3750569.1 hypothetical protein [Streptomyces sp. AK08-02]
MSEITGHRSTATAVVHESYSFACMRCGHGWEQSYEIEHHTDVEGGQMVMYVADGHVVQSPLTRPTCQNCDGHVVRIMRAGQVSSVQNSMHRQRSAPKAVPAGTSAETAEPGEAGTPKEDHHWHLSDLLHPFHRKAS